MSIRLDWFIVFVTIVALATDIVLLLNESEPRQQVIFINMALLVLLGVGSARIIRNLANQNYLLKKVVEKLQTPEACLDLDLEEQPDEAFMKTLDTVAHEARARMSSAVDKGPAGQP